MACSVTHNTPLPCLSIMLPGYIAQHAFHHIEKHMDKTPNEYIRWRYQFGDDREGLDQANMKLSPEDDAALKAPVEFSYKDEKGMFVPKTT